jgi:ATP-dependent Lon protease
MSIWLKGSLAVRCIQRARHEYKKAVGSVHDALLAYLDRETSARYRDQSLDAELDLSMVSFMATANDVSKLPSPLRDRLRVIKVPAPTLTHLSQLAASIMRDLEKGDDARHGDDPLAPDELRNIGRAWAPEQFSMRALQSIVLATLVARDQCAMRH